MTGGVWKTRDLEYNLFLTGFLEIGGTVTKSLLGGSGYLGYVDSNQGYNPYWVGYMSPN